MGAEPGSRGQTPALTRRARVVALLAAAALAVAALLVASSGTLASPAILADWSRRHPDPRALADGETVLLERLQGDARRADVLCLLGAVAAGCALVALRPRLAAACGGVRAAVLASGSVVLGLVLAGTAVVEQAQAARAGEWTLGDDNLDAVAGVHAPTLRQWRTIVPEGDAIILLGTDSYLWNVVAWALHPRPVYPLVQEVPPTMTEDELVGLLAPQAFARGHGARWAVDLAALREQHGGVDVPSSAHGALGPAHGALVKVDR